MYDATLKKRSYYDLTICTLDYNDHRIFLNSKIKITILNIGKKKKNRKQTKT